MAKEQILTLNGQKCNEVKDPERKRLSWLIPVAPNVITGVPIRERRRVTGPTQRRRPFEDGDRDWKLEKTRKYSPLEPLEGLWPCWPLDFGLRASKTVRELRICCFKVPGFWWFVYSIPRRLIQYPIPNRPRAFLFISAEATTVSLPCLPRW